MHTLEQLAAESKGRAIARHRTAIAILEQRHTLPEILLTSPLSFDKQLGAGLDYIRQFQIARKLAENLIQKLHPGGIDRVTISYGDGPHKFHIQARNSVWTGFALVSEQVLREEWERAESAVNARLVREEETRGRGPALDEAKIAKAEADSARVSEQMGASREVG